MIVLPSVLMNNICLVLRFMKSNELLTNSADSGYFALSFPRIASNQNFNRRFLTTKFWPKISLKNRAIRSCIQNWRRLTPFGNWKMKSIIFIRTRCFFHDTSSRHSSMSSYNSTLSSFISPAAIVSKLELRRKLSGNASVSFSSLLRVKKWFRKTVHEIARHQFSPSCSRQCDLIVFIFRYQWRVRGWLSIVANCSVR